MATQLAKPSLRTRIGMVLAGLFLPQFAVAPPATAYEGDPDQARLERPLPPQTQTRWFQSDIETAILNADGGRLSGYARLAKAMRRDGTFAGLMSTRAGGLIRLPREFRGTPDVVREFAVATENELALFDRVFPPKELENFVADGIVLGVAVGEFLPVPGRDEPVFVRLDPEFLRYVWSEDRWYYQTIAGLVHVRPGDGRWVLHTPGGYQAPWYSGLCPSLGRAYVAKEHAYLYRENFSGKLANPARVAVSPEGAVEEEKQGFFRKVMAWGVNTVFGLKPGWDVKLLESNGRGYDVFQATITSADREFAIGLAGQIVTVDGGAGFANADIHATIRSDLIQGDADALARTLNVQALPHVCNRLFGSGARCFVKWDTTPPADLIKTADAMTAAAEAIEKVNAAIAPYGLEVDAREMVTRYKIPVLAKALAPASPAPTAAPPPPPAVAGPSIVKSSTRERRELRRAS